MHIIHSNLAKGFRGGERQTVLLITALADKKHITRQTLVCQPDSPMRNELAKVDKVHIVTAKHQLMGHYATGRGTIVHAHEAKAVHWAWLHQALYKTPYIITRRVDTPIKRKLTNRTFYRNARYCVAISNVIAYELSSLNSRPIPVIPSALTPSASNPEIAATLRNDYAGRFLIGHIGALVDRHKGQRILLEAAKLLEKDYPNLLFLFFGQGEDEAILRNESAYLNNVRWMGFKSNILDYIGAFDLFAFPSRNEGLGSILLDVMNAKVPVIASNVGGIPDIIKHEKTGLLIHSGDADALANSIIRLRENAVLRQRLAQGATERLGQYSPQSMAASYWHLYKTIVN
ncbi:MAG: glycosyltransferase family 4 protein [Pseudomonadota bacterium]